MMKVVLDTNALFFPFQFKVNIENEISALVGKCEIVVPEIVVEELKTLRKKGNPEAGAALRYADRFRTFGGRSTAFGDTAVLDAAIELEAVLVTSDKELIRRAKEKGLKVIFLRGKQRLELK